LHLPAPLMLVRSPFPDVHAWSAASAFPASSRVSNGQRPTVLPSHEVGLYFVAEGRLTSSQPPGLIEGGERPDVDDIREESRSKDSHHCRRVHRRAAREEFSRNRWRRAAVRACLVQAGRAKPTRYLAACREAGFRVTLVALEECGRLSPTARRAIHPWCRSLECASNKWTAASAAGGRPSFQKCDVHAPQTSVNVSVCLQEASGVLRESVSQGAGGRLSLGGHARASGA
jgi:hypothetical protein